MSGLLDNVDEKTDKYNFVSDGISDFLNDYQQPKQEQNIREDVFDSFPIETEEIHDESEEPPRLKMPENVAKESANMLTIALDSSISGGLGLISKSDSSVFRADEDQQEQLASAIASMVRLKGDLPPWMALLVLIVTIYGPKVPLAFQLRKANTEKEALTRRAEAAERETERLNTRLKELEKKNAE